MDYLSINKASWDKRTDIHLESSFYDVQSFINGKCSLNPLEKELLGSVESLDLLHLQCHFGQDTLSLTRLGAKTTGVDLSTKAIDAAKRLSSELCLDANFICDDIVQFGEKNDKQFDVVYTSYGVLCWLPDLSQWAKTISNALKTGGKFVLVEFHPFNDLLAGYDYFEKQSADVEKEGTYTENCDGKESTIVTWSHSVSDVIQALINAGLEIKQYTESPYSPYDCEQNLQHVVDKGFVKHHKGKLIPQIFAIQAIKK
ncbi:class I SAM-dependent methyltransferase [Pseudoalteromonas sp. MTN2-4]|uniref:class I SAM-dependent methyltransferase n=1 Tax=Pseudoalteromonas sp. MTN2-4 TaxID=3056555 RepID=UPI0036F2BC89